MRIKLKTMEDITEFINICNVFTSDINVSDGNIVVDAKSVVAMFTLQIGKELKITINACDKEEEYRFYSKIEKFEATK